MTDTPEHALKEILEAISKRDYDKLSTRVDISDLLNEGYDDATEELSKHCAEFHELYPNDLFFQFGPQIVKEYNAKFRMIHIGFISLVIANYFNKNFKVPKNFDDDPVNFATAKFNDLLTTLKSNVKDIVEKDNQAIITVEVSGDDSEYGKLIGKLNFKLAFEKDSTGHWKLNKIANAEELVPPILDIAEQVWPKSWDLGMKF